MSQRDVETIRGLSRGVEERDLEAYLAACDRNVVIREPGSLPYGGEYHGREGVRRHAAGFQDPSDCRAAMRCPTFLNAPWIRV